MIYNHKRNLMLTPIQKIRVTHILDGSLGIGHSMKNDERAHYCPFCHHAKRKLQVNITSGRWHCWVCDAKGKRIYNLLKKLDVSRSTLTEIKQIYGDTHYVHKKSDEPEIILQLPKEFVSLRLKPKGMNPLYLNVKAYATERGITNDDIIKHNIGYCNGGSFSGRIIIPSYDSDNQLNYFIARTIYPDVSFVYKNPPVSKNIIAFENQINWNDEIILVEGIFDALAIKRNVIPMFGKYLSRKLRDKILIEHPPLVTVCLDNDAVDGSVNIIEFLLKNDINVKFVRLPINTDPSIVGFVNMISLIKTSTNVDFSSLISLKIGLI